MLLAANDTMDDRSNYTAAKELLAKVGLADRFGLSKEDFEAKFVREIGTRKSLSEYINGDCVFYDRFHTNCKIYRDRPVQCRTWPFWDCNLKDEAAWENASRGCKGCNRGKLYTVEEIEARKNEREM